MVTEPFAHASGPRQAKIAIVGEAWGQQEALIGKPFVGASGQELTRMLRDAGIERSQCFLTNVLPLQPPGNAIEALCVRKSEVGDGYAFPPIRQGHYLRPDLTPEVDRLRAELAAVQPTVVVALGNTAAWALLGRGGISSIRGVVAPSTLVPGLKVLPTFHPAAILRQWALRAVALADLIKARREAEFPEIRRPRREVLIDPTLAEIKAWAERPHIALAVDTETARGMIRTIQFARSPYEALVIPFCLHDSGQGNYWPCVEDEIRAWTWVRYLLELPIPKIFQNGLYDLQYIWKMGIRPRRVEQDTMLLHHSLYPELQKGLGFLGSIYTQEASWKLMRNRRGEEELKHDE